MTAVAWSILKRLDWRIVAAVLVALVAAIALHRWAENLKELGRIEVRQQWAEAQRRADLNQLALVASQQKQINAADAALSHEIVSRAVLVAGLEAALADERAKTDHNEGNSKDAKHDAGEGADLRCSAVPAMPGWLRNTSRAPHSRA